MRAFREVLSKIRDQSCGRYGKKSELCSRLAAEVGRRMQVYGPMIPPKLDPETTDVPEIGIEILPA